MGGVARGLRIVAGTAGGRLLVAPRGGARPTTDRVKEALFAMLGDTVVGATVLDLYAGSGALALEALSRGAERAVLVDHDRDAAGAVRANLRTTGFAGRARLQRSRVSVFLATLPAEAPFDVVFADPPYRTPPDEVTKVLASLAQPGWLAPGALVVVERAAGDRPTYPDGWSAAKERTYGDTLVAVLTT
jgi:16S rRNA (guanine966-N2)-methyltransferase